MNKLIPTLIIAGALLVSCGSATTTNTNAGVSTGTGVDMSGATPAMHIAGNPQSKVVLVEFSDLQCPACKNADPSVKSILKDYGDRIRFEYRHFPLEMHMNSKKAAYAAVAADKQGKFWEMKDKLFATQEEWGETPEPMQMYVTYAKDLGLDTTKFEQDANSQAVKDAVEKDIALGNQIGVNATPSFYLNGKRLRPNSFSEFTGLIQEAVLNQK